MSHKKNPSAEAVIPQEKSNYHAIDTLKVLQALQTSKDQGLSRAEVDKRFLEYGANELEQEERESIWSKIKEQFEDLLVRLLLAAAIISFIVAQFGI